MLNSPFMGAVWKEGMRKARYESETYVPEQELLNQLHWRLDPIIEEYRREKKTDDRRRPAVRLADGSLFRHRSIVRDYAAADGRVVTLTAEDGPHIAGRVKAPTLAHDDRFRVFIEVNVKSPDQRRYVVAPSGETAAAPASTQRERYRVVEDQDGPHVYGIPETGARRLLDPGDTEQLLWLVQTSTPVPAEG